MNKGEKKRETVGKLSTELLQKQTSTHSPIDLTSELLSDYEKSVWECVNTYRSVNFAHDFYVVVITKKEPLMQNVLRNYFLARYSCPTPDYDQTVYSYGYKDDKLEFIWTIPSKDACLMLKENAHQVSPEEYGLLEYVLKFADGTLFELAKKLNGEKSLESSLIDN